MARKSNDNKQQRILDAAVVEIAQHGYYHTTVARIAARAGVADGTIYLYFKNKEELLLRLFERAMERFSHEGRERLAAVATAREKLTGIVDLHLSLVGEDRDLAIITQVELRHSLHVLAHLSRTLVGDYLEVLTRVIEQGQAEGEFRRDLEPTFVAKAVFGVLDEMATDWVLSRRNTRLAGRAPAVTDFLLSGLLAPSDSD